MVKKERKKGLSGIARTSRRSGINVQETTINAYSGLDHADAGTLAIVLIGTGFGGGADLYLWYRAVKALLVESEQFLTDDGARLCLEVGCQPLHALVVALLQFLVGIGLAMLRHLQACQHEHATGCPARLTHSAYASTKRAGEASHEGFIYSIILGKGHGDTLRTVVALLEEGHGTGNVVI